MDRAYTYFPGCSLKGTGAAYDESLRVLFRLLDLRLNELEDWNCCGATSYMSIDEESAFVLSARNLALAHRAKDGDLLAPCSACYLVLRKTEDYVQRYPKIGKDVRRALSPMEFPPAGAVKVRHPLEVLFTDVGVDRIKSLVKRPWTGGRVACYYGCQIVRPYHEVDRSHDPQRMDDLLHAAGVPTVDYALKTKCCGGSLTGTTHEVGVRLNYVLLKEAVRKGAQAIATVCPLCQYNLDAYQSELRRKTGEKLDVPIFYFTQVLAWTLGARADTLALNRLISGRKFVEQWFPKDREKAEAYV